MTNKRDNFSPKVIEKLRSRVANRCSNPDCRVPTTGPTLEANSVNNIGIAAHICAASPGGPRFAVSMTRKERTSIQNAIWLCSICATKIDRDPNRYSTKLLNTWKNQAEEIARRELGHKLPNQQDIVNTLSATLTGLPSCFLPEAIHNTCTASIKALELLDPRFKIDVSYHNNLSCFSVSAKEKVDCSFFIDQEYEKEFLEKYKNFVAHGESLVIDSRAVSIQGSPLFEMISSDTREGKFMLLPGFKKAAVLKIWLTNKITKDHFILNDVVGDVTLGKESFNFTGSVYNGILKFVSRKGLSSDTHNKFVFNIKLNLDKWDGLPINKLPYFEKIYKFYKYINEAWNINNRLEVDGHDIFSGFSPGDDYETDIKKPYLLFRFIFLANSVLEYLGKSIFFNKNFEYSREIHERLYEAYKIISGNNCYKYDQLVGYPTCTLIVDKNLENINLLRKSAEPHCIKLVQEATDSIILFGESIKLPRYRHIYTKVIPRLSQDTNCIKPGDKIFVEWFPEKDCEYIIDFVDD